MCSNSMSRAYPSARSHCSSVPCPGSSPPDRVPPVLVRRRFFLASDACGWCRCGCLTSGRPGAACSATSGQFAPTSHLPHLWLSVFSPYQAALFFSAFVLVILYTVTLVHGYFDSGWRPGTGGQIQYISIEKACQNIEN